MNRRTFLLAIPVVPAIAVLKPQPQLPWLAVDIEGPSYSLLTSNLYATPGVLTEKMMRQFFDDVAKATPEPPMWFVNAEGYSKLTSLASQGRRIRRSNRGSHLTLNQSSIIKSRRF